MKVTSSLASKYNFLFKLFIESLFLKRPVPRCIATISNILNHNNNNAISTCWYFHRFHLVSFGLCGVSVGPSQSINHSGEVEGGASGRLCTKLRDDLMALPEKSNGDRRWRLYFPLAFGCSGGDILNLWFTAGSQLSPLVDAKLGQISLARTYSGFSL